MSSLGYTFNNTHSINDHGVRMLVEGMSTQILPARRDQFVEMPGMDGSYLFPGPLSDRIITRKCVVNESSPMALRTKARQIAAWLNTSTWAQLIFDDEPDVYYLAKVVNEIEEEQIISLGAFAVQWRCSPLAIGTEVTEGFVSDAVTVTNSGTYETFPVFAVVFTATATEWKVTLGTKYIRVVNAFAIGNTLEVNCATGAVLINGSRAMDKLDWQNSEFFALAVGNNALAITPANKCTATVKFSPRFL